MARVKNTCRTVETNMSVSLSPCCLLTWGHRVASAISSVFSKCCNVCLKCVKGEDDDERNVAFFTPKI